MDGGNHLRLLNIDVHTCFFYGRVNQWISLIILLYMRQRKTVQERADQYTWHLSEIHRSAR